MMGLLDHLLGTGLLAIAVGPGDGLAVPVRASDVAESVDWTFNLLLFVSIFFIVLITGLALYFVIRFRDRGDRALGKGPSHSMALELIWTIIPSLLVLVIFYSGFKGFMQMSLPQANSYEIMVTGQKWSWEFTYPNGFVDKDLHLPVDREIRLVLTSTDVIHSLFIPAFRVKKDVVPGRYNKLWFRATKPGTYVVTCAEYCGTGHSDMSAQVIVHPPGEFEQWLRLASDFISSMPPVKAGERVFQTRGCTQCHSVTGVAGIGPTLKGVFGETVQLKGGERTEMDEDYIRESILNPQAKIVQGFEPVMPTFQGRIKDKEIGVLIAYIKSLGEGGDEAPAEGEK